MSFNDDTAGLFNPYGLSLVQNADGTQTLIERDQLLEYYRGLLLAVVADPARVQIDPPLPGQARPGQFELPYLVISLGSETSQILSKSPMTVARRVELQVDVVTAETALAPAQRVANSIARAIEQIFLWDSDRPDWIADVEPPAVDPASDATAAAKLGGCRLTFPITYLTLLPEPPEQL